MRGNCQLISVRTLSVEPFYHRTMPLVFVFTGGCKLNATNYNSDTPHGINARGFLYLYKLLAWCPHELLGLLRDTLEKLYAANILQLNLFEPTRQMLDYKSALVPKDLPCGNDIQVHCLYHA